MLSTVTPEQRRAAYALSQQTWWPSLREQLVMELAVVHELMTDATIPVSLHQLQGRAKAIRDWLELIATAAAMIAKN